MAKSSNGGKVCVTGSESYIGSLLVKKLLQRGYSVHATLRTLDDVTKVSLLKSLPGSDERLVLFKADIYNHTEFEHAIQGCEFVFHLATPLEHHQNSQYKSTTEAAIAGAKSILESCLKSRTIRRLIYTASVFAASPLKDDGSGFKDYMNETCWTPLNLQLPYSSNSLKDYLESKTLAEKHMLSYENNSNSGLKVVSLVCGLVGGNSLLPFTPSSVAVFISQFTNNESEYNTLRFLEELLGKIPIVHIDDACDAHIFCMEDPSISGRFLCTSSYVSSAELLVTIEKTTRNFK